MVDDEAANEAVIDQAVSWLVRLDAGSADTEAFETWRDADPRHASAFAQVASTWARTASAAGADCAEPPSAAVALDAISEPASVNPGISRRAMIGSAIGALLAASGGAFLWTRPAQAATAVGERRTIRLPDGSRAELNTDTRIEWRFGDRRELWLMRGEAALTIAADIEHPFLLRADSLRATLEPGQYGMRQFTEGRQRLMTLAGRARVAAGRGPQRDLLPGQAVTVIGDSLAVRQIDAAAAARLSAWRQGEIVFDGMTLREALTEFNRHLAQPMEIADPDIGTERLGGRFFVDDPAAFLAALHDGFGIASRSDDGRVLLYRPNIGASAPQRQKYLRAP